MQIKNFFYTLGDFFGNTSKNAKKQYFNTRIPYEINKGKVYTINTAVPYNIYTTIPQFRIPINKLASMFANGVFMIRDDKGNLNPLPTNYAKLLEKPNILQSQNSFMELYVKQLKVYGNQYIRKNQASKLAPPVSLMCISPTFIKPELTGKLLDQISIEGIISHYDYCDSGKTKQIPTDEILWSKIDDLDNPLIGCSPLIGLQFPISNTELAYKYLNCISGERGALGILSRTPQKDSMGALPETAEEKQEIHDMYTRLHGVEDGQIKTIITSAQLTYTPMSYETSKLLLLEQIDANFLTILAELGVNSNLFVNSTYENLRHGLIQTHNDTVVPMADSFCQSLGDFIGLKGLTLDYSHLPYLQLDKLNEATTFAQVSNALTALVSGGIITPEEAKKRLENQFGSKV